MEKRAASPLSVLLALLLLLPALPAAAAGGGAPATDLSPSPPRQAQGKGSARTRIRKGAVVSSDPASGLLSLRPSGGGPDESYPAGARVSLDSLHAGDNVVVTVRDGVAVSVRPFRAVPKAPRPPLPAGAGMGAPLPPSPSPASPAPN